MKRFITIDDIIDVLHKSKQRGLGFVLSKLSINGIKKTKKTFDQLDYKSADCWTIPKVKKRWNQLITGNSDLDFKKYFVDNFLQNENKLRLVSIGSGSCYHEIELAKYANFEEIICIDITKDRISKAEATANELNLKNIKFTCADIYNYDFPNEYFDIIFFHSSLHHFDNIEKFIKTIIKKGLKTNGLLVINEYVGATRFQFPKNQIAKINEALRIIPKEYKIRYKSNLLKRKYYGSGILRMIIADPSECIDSENILPSIHSNFHVVIEKPYGGNILLSTLKDISHHFIDLDSRKDQVLDELFLLEDEYLVNNPSDLVFGIYQKL
ncbi:MAG: class I SAM-dependent methyltransferase [Bacteroidota bacterium]